MSKSHSTWLLSELDRWERDGVLDRAAAARIRGLYKVEGARSPRATALIAFGVLGALLIGGGTILLLAHNWADLGRAVRTVLALTPLSVALLLAWVGVARSKVGVAWRESVATFWVLSVGAALSLVSQIYHLSGSFDGFMLAWLLLGGPIVYVMRSTMAAALYLLGVLAWTCSHAGDDLALAQWAMMAVLAPFIVSCWRSHRYATRTTLLLWVLAGTVTAGVELSLSRAVPGLWTVINAALFALFLLLDDRWFSDAPSLWHRPLRIVGAAGGVVLALLFTYAWPWREVGWNYYRDQVPAWRQAADAVFALGFAGWAAALAVLRRRALRGAMGFAACFPLAAVAGLGLSSWGHSSAAMLLFNGYVLAMGLMLLIGGLRRRALAPVNAGMLLMGALITLRFFDSDLNLLARGVVFVALGVAFLMVNGVMARLGRRTP